MPETIAPAQSNRADRVALGFDPGRDKCGIARVALTRSPDGNRSYSSKIEEMAVVESAVALDRVVYQCQQFDVSILAIGDGTSSKQWCEQLETVLPDSVLLVKVNEYNSTQEARERYWDIYPPRGLTRLIPVKLRSIPRPIDDIVAAILVERWVKTQG